jgi:hypothetical protein
MSFFHPTLCELLDVVAAKWSLFRQVEFRDGEFRISIGGTLARGRSAEAAFQNLRLHRPNVDVPASWAHAVKECTGWNVNTLGRMNSARNSA